MIKRFLEDKNISNGKRISEDLENEIARVKNVISREEGVPKKGESIFKVRCSSCHKMFANGGQIGPDLTSYQKNDQDTLLISVIAPGAEIREGYENIILKTLDGIIYSGFLLEDTKNNLIIRQLNGITKILSKTNIVSTTMTGVSLMPMGLIDGLSDDEIRNLFAYLRSTTPPF